MKLLMKKQGVLTAVRGLTEQESKQYEEDLEEMVRFEEYLLLIGFVKTNHLELEREIAGILSELYVSEGHQPYPQGVTARSNLRLLNFLGAMRLFLDHTNFRLSRTYGKGSPEHSVFRKKTREVYSGSCAYRFLYRMRNFAQHCGLPIGHVGVTSSVDEQDTKRKEHRFQVVVRPHELLSKDRGAWGSEVAAELEQGPTQLELIPLVREVSSGLSEIHRTVAKAIQPKAQEAAGRVDALLDEGRRAGGEVVAVGEIDERGNEGKFHMHILEPPGDMMEFLGFPGHRRMVRR